MAEKSKSIPTGPEFENKELLQKVLAELLDTTVEILDSNLEDSENTVPTKETLEPKKKFKNVSQ